MKTARDRAAIVAMVLLAADRRRVRRGRESGAGAADRARAHGGLGNRHVRRGLDRRRRPRAFGKVIKAFNKVYPDVQDQVQPARQQPLDGARGRRSPAAIRRTWPTSPSRDTSSSSSSRGKLKPITYAKSVICANFAPAWQSLGTFSRQALRARLQGVQQVAVLVQRARFQGGRREAAEDVGAADHGRARRSGLGHARRTRSAARTAGRSPTCSRTSTCARSGRRSTTQLTAHEIKWTDPSVITALKTMAPDHRYTSNMAGGTSGALQTASTTRSRTRSATPPKAAMVFEGDFVVGRDPLLDEGEGRHRVQRVAVPVDQAGPGSTAVEIGGDLFVTFRDTPAIEAFVKFLATPRRREGVGGDRAASRPGNKQRAVERLPGCDRQGDRRRRSARRSRSCSTCPTSSRPRSARRPARASGGSSRRS